MKILFLTNLYPPYVRGGAEYLGAQMVEELVRQGHKVAVLTSVPWKGVRGFWPLVREEAGVRVYRFFPINLYHYLTASQLSYPVRFLWQLVNLWNPHAGLVTRRVLRTEQPDLVVSFNLMGLGFNLPRLIASFKLPHVHVLHDVQLLHPSGLFIWGTRHRPLPSRVYQAITRWLMQPITAVVSPSAWLMREHESRGIFRSARRTVLPNPVPQFQATAQTKTTHRPLQLLYVGQLEVHKGVFWLVQTIRQSKQSDFVLHLVALGQRPRLKELQALVGGDQRVAVHDLMSQAEIDGLYQSSHLTVVPSLCYENSPTAITKSLSAGTPVLAVNLGGIPELVQVGLTGWLYEPADAKDFLKKLSWCLAHPAKLLSAGLVGSRDLTDRTLAAYARVLLMAAHVQ